MVKLTETRFTFLSLNLHFRHLCTHLVYHINCSKSLPNGFPVHLSAFSFSIKFSRQISHRMKEATGEIQKKIAQFIERDRGGPAERQFRRFVNLCPTFYTPPRTPININFTGGSAVTATNHTETDNGRVRSTSELKIL